MILFVVESAKMILDAFYVIWLILRSIFTRRFRKRKSYFIFQFLDTIHANSFQFCSYSSLLKRLDSENRNIEII